jgi:hypothetical protein
VSTRLGKMRRREEEARSSIIFLLPGKMEWASCGLFWEAYRVSTDSSSDLMP